MSFGFGIGDFVAALEIANRVSKAFLGAPRQFKSISECVAAIAVDGWRLTSQFKKTRSLSMSFKMPMPTFQTTNSSITTHTCRRFPAVETSSASWRERWETLRARTQRWACVSKKAKRIWKIQSGA
jgi:hypothetical protein